MILIAIAAQFLVVLVNNAMLDTTCGQVDAYHVTIPTVQVVQNMLQLASNASLVIKFGLTAAWNK